MSSSGGHAEAQRVAPRFAPRMHVSVDQPRQQRLAGAVDDRETGR
jgi:hypothetical protein